MDKEEILKASRKEHKNKDFAELEILYQAESHAGRVGALACYLVSLLSSLIAQHMLYSPWGIYFSMIGTQWLFRFQKQKQKSDLLLAVTFFLLAGLTLYGLVARLFEVAA